MFKKITIGLILSVLIIGQLTVISEASATGVNNGIEFFVNYAEPAVSDKEGYITLLLRNTSTGEYCVETYFWYTIATVNGYDSPAYMYMTMNSGAIRFRPAGSSGATSAFFSLSSFSNTGRYGYVYSSSTESYLLNLGSFGWQIKAFKVAGNIGFVDQDGSIDNNSNLFSVYFAEDGSAMLLMDIISLLHSMQNIDSSILSTVSSILGSVDGVENQLSSVISYLQSVDSKLSSISSQLQTIYNKANEILNEQKQTNTWLEKIFNYLDESAEKQKQEAQTQGDNSSSQGMNAIEDKGGDFASSLGGLTSSMSYSGTECAWEFPEVKIPAINGVMDEVVLIKKQPIDFSVWVNAIPSGILLVVQSVCTIGLIVYCFKELYSTIAYVLTLRKDDNS